jgi:hypothetical protein
MKKVIFVITAIFITSLGFAQEISDKEKTDSKALEFMSNGSSLIKKEFYDLKSVKGVKCQVLIITNILQNSKMGCLRLETRYTGYSTSDTYIGTLDYDEIDDCIKSINYIKDNLLISTPSVYTETEYRTRDRIEVGAYYNEKQSVWKAYVYTKSYTSRSAEYFDASSLASLAEVMEQAKIMIEEKTK